MTRGKRGFHDLSGSRLPGWVSVVLAGIYGLIALGAHHLFDALVFSCGGPGVETSSPVLWIPLLFPLIPLLIARNPASIVFCVVQPLILVSLAVVFHSHGEVVFYMIAPIAWATLIPALVLLLPELSMIAFVLMGLPCLLYFCAVGYYTSLWVSAHREAIAVAHYIQGVKEAHAEYPADLEGYEPISEEAMSRVAYSPPNPYRPWTVVTYFVSSPSMSHTLYVEGSAWHYYPD